MCIASHRKCIKYIAYHNISNLKQFHLDALSSVRLKDVVHVFEMHSGIFYINSRDRISTQYFIPLNIVAFSSFYEKYCLMSLDENKE